MRCRGTGQYSLVPHSSGTESIQSRNQTLWGDLDGYRIFGINLWTLGERLKKESFYGRNTCRKREDKQEAKALS